MTLLPLVFRRLFPFAVFVVACLSGSLVPRGFADELQLPDEVRFNRDVRTIFSKTCFACHGPDANAREAKLRLDVREEAVKARKDGSPIVPGDAAKSLAYQLITAEDADDQMPPADFHTQLSAREKAMIEKRLRMRWTM